MSAHPHVGRRVQIPPHYDLWMRGARYGVVVRVGARGRVLYVQMDHPSVRRLVRVATDDATFVDRARTHPTRTRRCARCGDAIRPTRDVTVRAVPTRAGARWARVRELAAAHGIKTSRSRGGTERVWLRHAPPALIAQLEALMGVPIATRTRRT